MTPKQRAVETLAFYFETLYEKAGLAWGLDNRAEIENVVNDIVTAATEPEIR